MAEVTEYETVEVQESHGGLWAAGGIIWGIIAIIALILAAIAFKRATDASNSGLHTDFQMQIINTTLSGVCNDFPVEIAYSKVGNRAMIQVPYFICDGTANDTDGTGLRFTVPEGFDADVDFARSSDADVDTPFPHVYVTWCVGNLLLKRGAEAGRSVRRQPNKTGISALLSCSLFNNSIAYIDGTTVHMGTDPITQFDYPGTNSYGPQYGFTLIYYATTGSNAPVSAALSAIPHMGMLAGIVAASLAAI